MLVLLLVFGYMLTWFGLALMKNDNGIIDIAWGLGFVLIAWMSLAWSGTDFSQQYLINILVSIWGIRLAVYLDTRNKAKGKEDFRYANWRKQWGENWIIRTFLQVFMLQGYIMLWVCLPIICVHQAPSCCLGFWDFFGTLLFAIGLYWEVVADHQLSVFKKDPANKGKIITTGLWKYSRHPNYFGEAVLWWGLGFIAFGSNYPYPIVAFIGPAVITFFLRYVSGVPMLERKYKDHPEFIRYARKTSPFVPMFPEKG